MKDLSGVVGKVCGLLMLVVVFLRDAVLSCTAVFNSCPLLLCDVRQRYVGAELLSIATTINEHFNSAHTWNLTECSVVLGEQHYRSKIREIMKLLSCRYCHVDFD